jgi:hypothetical protein
MSLAQVIPTQHPSDHDVDLFVLHRVPPEERLRLELHLLTCPTCCRQAENTVEFVEALRSACCMSPAVQ